MPVQDNDDKRTAEQPMNDAEEEARRKQAQAQTQDQSAENSVQKSGKLLPFLNAKAQHHESRIERIDSKIANQKDNIAKHKAAIDTLTAKADKLEDTNRMLKATLGNIPLVRAFINKNEKKIAEIREQKIPNRKEKIANCEEKIGKLTAKRDVISHKLDRVVALNDTIKSFSLGLNKQRREVFAGAMDRLNQATMACMLDKRTSLEFKKNELLAKYDDPKTSEVDKLGIQDKINDVSEKINALTEKISKLDRHEGHFAEKSDVAIDAAMVVTADKLSDMTSNGTVTMPDLAENAVEAAQEVDTMTAEQQKKLANALENAEVQLEDDYNMIDGIINNGSKSELEAAKDMLLEKIDATQSIANDTRLSAEIREAAFDDVSNLKKDLSKVETALSILDEVEADIAYDENVQDVQDWLMDMVADGKAEMRDDGSFRVNPDYYKEIPRNDRHVESMTAEQASIVMQELEKKGVEFSAASKGDDKVGITVAKKDLVALNDVMYQTIGKLAQTETLKENAQKASKGTHQTVNPEYYASLPKEQRHMTVQPVEVAREIVKQLNAQKIPYSAVVRKNGTVAMTVSKQNADAFKQAESAVKGERAAKYINPSFYKALPKEFRVTQMMTEEQAKAKVAELDKKGIAHSAVLDGEKSAVTVSRKDAGRAMFSRSQLKKEAQRISNKGKSEQQKQKAPKKKDNQEL